MASTYSDLKIELIGTGEQVGTWGTTTNVNLGTALEEAIASSADVTFSSTNVTLTLTNTNASQTARHLRLRLVGTSGGARTLTLPAIEKSYVIKNELADTVTVQNATGSGVAVASGTSSYVYSTGAGVEEVISSSIFIPSGVITMWSGSIATIPFGWALCDGSTYGAVTTPDLTEKFVVGANTSGTFIVGATGGSANATLPAHTHGASTSISDPGHAHISRVYSSGNEASGYGLELAVAFQNRVAVLANDGERLTASASTGISASTSISSTGASATNANLPPYFALAYIMKL
jgi:microcystin-dependent protein